MPTNDLQLLLPSFRVLVEDLVARMRERGFDPKVHETYRSPERAKLLVLQGRSRARGLSLHCFGAAADIISKSRGYEWPEFFRALGDEAKSLGLTWGGDWDSDPNTPNRFDDRPHVQAIPVRLQDAFRALQTDGERDRYVRARLPMRRV